MSEYCAKCGEKISEDDGRLCANCQEPTGEAHHGVIEMNVAKSFPDATVKYDLRKMACQSQNTEVSEPRTKDEQ